VGIENERAFAPENIIEGGKSILRGSEEKI
jgi:hypothetical protein